MLAVHNGRHPETRVSEQALILRARAGDEAAFTPLVETYQTAIYNLCYRMLGDAGEAEDAAQETFLRAYAQLHSYDSSRSFKTWLFSIASHHCIDRLRKRRLIWLSIDDEALHPHPALRERTPGPEEQSMRREQSEAVQALLARLAPEDRKVIVMRYWYDLSYEEIAQTTGTTVSAVKSRLHRARGFIAEMMKSAQAESKAPRPSAHPAFVEG
jgi:RNA polymerase sigma-70 factor (ECF subfamily)